MLFLQGHSNFVTHMDWSKDGKYLQTVSGDYDLMFWDLVDMKEMRPQLARDIEWHTETCILGYNSLGRQHIIKQTIHKLIIRMLFLVT